MKEISTDNTDYSTLTETQKLNNLMAHAILGGVIAELSGGNSTAGAIGAATGELAAPAIALVLYGTSDSKELTSQQKDNISALATLASGIAGGVSSDSTAGAATGAQAGKNAVENNYLSVSEKSELDIAKQKLRNSKDPAEREQAEKDVARLTELDISRDGAVLAACGNGAAGSAACAASRVEAYQFKAEYENTGNYNSRASQQYADAYGKIVNLLNITSVDAQNQQQVKDAMVNYAMQQLGVDKATAEQYVSTYDGMKIVAASMTPVIGSAAASKLSALVNEANSSNAALSVSERVKENIAVSEKARESSNFGQYSKAEGGVQETLGIWPPNRGAYGPVEKVILPTGEAVDRYGYPGGSFVSPVGVPFTERALPSSYEATKPYFKYEIIKPIPDVPKSKILPWFGQKGTGTQYELPKPVQWYLDNGYMKKVDE